MKSRSKVEFFTLKDEQWFIRQQHAGKCVAAILQECGRLILDGTKNLNLKKLELVAYQKCDEYKCVPTFLGYDGFPSAACISVNRGLVHGIVTDYVLQPGDIVSVDLGATYDGAIADAARTWIYGRPKEKEHVEMLEVCKLALINGQNAFKIGNRIGAIGNAIHRTISKTRFGSVTKYGGHGIGYYNEPHAAPFVSNKDSKNNGVHIADGMSIAIEPMVVLGDTSTYVGSDGWTVFTNNVGCHFENSITIFEGKKYVVTDYDGLL